MFFLFGGVVLAAPGALIGVIIGEHTKSERWEEVPALDLEAGLRAGGRRLTTWRTRPATIGGSGRRRRATPVDQSGTRTAYLPRSSPDSKL